MTSRILFQNFTGDLYSLVRRRTERRLQMRALWAEGARSEVRAAPRQVHGQRSRKTSLSDTTNVNYILASLRRRCLLSEFGSRGLRVFFDVDEGFRRSDNARLSTRGGRGLSSLSSAGGFPPSKPAECLVVLFAVAVFFFRLGFLASRKRPARRCALSGMVPSSFSASVF